MSRRRPVRTRSECVDDGEGGVPRCRVIGLSPLEARQIFSAGDIVDVEICVEMIRDSRVREQPDDKSNGQRGSNTALATTGPHRG